jgi:hypothetical protein
MLLEPSFKTLCRMTLNLIESRSRLFIITETASRPRTSCHSGGKQFVRESRTLERIFGLSPPHPLAQRLGEISNMIWILALLGTGSSYPLFHRRSENFTIGCSRTLPSEQQKTGWESRRYLRIPTLWDGEALRS